MSSAKSPNPSGGNTKGTPNSTQKNVNPKQIQRDKPMGALKKGQQSKLKNVFDTPFNAAWPVIQSEDDRQDIIDAIGKQTNLSFQSVTKKTMKEAAPEVVLGINAITKILDKQIKSQRDLVKLEDQQNPKTESKELSLVILCVSKKDASTETPVMLFQHIPTLCHLANVKLAVVPNSSKPFGDLFKINSLLAFGFLKKMRPEFQTVVDFVLKKTPNFSIPWLDRLQPQPEQISSSNTKRQKTDDEGNHSAKKQKKKRERNINH